MNAHPSPIFLSEQNRLLNDMLQAEYALREHRESAMRELRDLLSETAARLDGQRFERMRKGDPNAPACWTTAEWRAFFSAIPAPGGWGSPPSALTSSDANEQRVRETLAKLEAAEQQLSSSLEKLARVEKRFEELTRADVKFAQPSTLLEGSIAPMPVLLQQVNALAEQMPARLPALQKLFEKDSRKGGDLRKALTRAYLVTYLIGRQRLSSTMEIETLLGDATDASGHAGSLRRVLEDLILKEVLVSQTLSMSVPRTALKVVRFAPKGTEVFRQLFESDPLENDWERMIRLHEGAKYLEHTQSVLYFGVHSRKRGYYTCILPDVQGHAAPDIWIARGQSLSADMPGVEQALYVEVELGSKEHEAKWRNLAALNNGLVALCAGNARLRERYVADCKLDGASVIRGGAAVDLEQMVQYKYIEVNGATPLWSEEW